jgi:hypothetical protein
MRTPPAPCPDPPRHSLALLLEQLVQQAQGDVMGGGDLRRGQPGVVRVLLDEREAFGDLAAGDVVDGYGAS